MIARQLEGVLPKPGAFSGADTAMMAMADGMIAKAREAMKTQQLHQVLNAVWAVVAEANRYHAGVRRQTAGSARHPARRTAVRRARRGAPDRRRRGAAGAKPGLSALR